MVSYTTAGLLATLMLLVCLCVGTVLDAAWGSERWQLGVLCTHKRRQECSSRNPDAEAADHHRQNCYAGYALCDLVC